MCKQVSYVWARVLLGSLCVWSACAEHFVQVCTDCVCEWCSMHSFVLESMSLSVRARASVHKCVQILAGGDPYRLSVCTDSVCASAFLCVCTCAHHY